MSLASFASHTLPIWANWSQFLGGVGLVGGVWAWYMRHRCFHCWKPGRFHVGEHRVPVCHAHRETPARPPRPRPVRPSDLPPDAWPLPKE